MSTNAPRSVRTRSRGKSLLRARCRSRALGGPPFLISATLAFSVETSARFAASLARKSSWRGLMLLRMTDKGVSPALLSSGFRPAPPQAPSVPANPAPYDPPRETTAFPPCWLALGRAPAARAPAEVYGHWALPPMSHPEWPMPALSRLRSEVPVHMPGRRPDRPGSIYARHLVHPTQAMPAEPSPDGP